MTPSWVSTAPTASLDDFVGERQQHLGEPALDARINVEAGFEVRSGRRRLVNAGRDRLSTMRYFSELSRLVLPTRLRGP
jgi:hypothetical protein